MRTLISSFLVWSIGYPVSALLAATILSLPLHFDQQLGWWADAATIPSKPIGGVLVVATYVAVFSIIPAINARRRLRMQTSSLSSYVSSAISTAMVGGTIVSLLRSNSFYEPPSALDYLEVFATTLSLFFAAGAVGGFAFGTLAAVADRYFSIQTAIAPKLHSTSDAL